MNKGRIRRIIATMLVLVLSVLTGYTVGNIYISTIPPETIVNGSEDKLRDDTTELIEKYKSGDYSITDFSAVENYQIAEYVYKNQENYYKFQTGTVKAKAAGINQTQEMQAQKFKNGNNFMVEKICKGLVSIAKRFYYDKDKEKVTVYYGDTDKIKSKDGFYTTEYSSKSKMDHDKYIDDYATSFENTMPYIVSSITCANDYKITRSHKNEDGTYTFTLEFEEEYAQLAGFYYAYEVKNSSGLEKPPTFKYLAMDVTINSDWEFVRVVYREEYTMLYTGLIANVTDLFYEDFFYDYREIPTTE